VSDAIAPLPRALPSRFTRPTLPAHIPRIVIIALIALPLAAGLFLLVGSISRTHPSIAMQALLAIVLIAIGLTAFALATRAPAFTFLKGSSPMTNQSQVLQALVSAAAQDKGAVARGLDSAGVKLEDLTVEISSRVHPTFGAVAKELAGPTIRMLGTQEEAAFVLFCALAEKEERATAV